MASILPKEETIIDPLYEPLKLNRYELCDHLTMLSNVSHLRYGFSPYLLFDVEGWKEVVKVIRYLFGSGTEVEEELDKDAITEELKKKFEDIYLPLSKEAKKYKGGDGWWEIRDKDKKIYIIKKRDKINIFDNFVKFSREFEEGINDYFDYSEKLPDRKERNGYYKELKAKRDKIKERYYWVKKEYKRILDDFLYQKGEFNKNNFNRIVHLFRLDYPVKVKCPRCKENHYMLCEEGKIYSMKEALLRTFELRRAKWLQMSGSLHTVHRASTHTRLSHQIGSMIAGVNALREIDVYPVGDTSMSLGEYLLMRGELHEFLMANFLHDIGHSPLSHVLEPNPFIKLDHEEITRNLILGKAVKGDGKGEMDWYVAERYLLKMKAIKDFEHRFLENRYDPIYDVGEKKWKDEERKAKFLKYVEINGEILESEVVTVSEVLENFGVDKDRVVEILSGKMFCPKCEKLLKIEDGKVEKCEDCGAVKIESERIYDTQFLNKLIESEIDLDRMDHVKRDSVVCGLSLTSFRLLELLGSMSVVLPDSDVCTEIYNPESNGPYILISENGLLYVMDLLNARKSVFNDVLYSDANNWINGVVNQITALAVRFLPHITNMLPFITDQILMHFYTNDLFLGTQIEKLNRLFHGKMGCSGYGKPMRYRLIEGAKVTEDNLRDMHKKIERINNGYDGMNLPTVVFYTNIKPTKCPVCRGKRLEEKRVGDHNIKVVICENCEYNDGNEEEKIGEMVYLVGIEENLFKISACPICGENIKKRENFQDFIECKGCGRRMRRWTEENWDNMLVYGKKFNDGKYHKFKDLAGTYKETSKERFPEKPSELDVKNLFYVWVSDFAITYGSNQTKSSENKEKWENKIKDAIGGVFYEKGGTENFDRKFVNLDVFDEGESKVNRVGNNEE